MTTQDYNTDPREKLYDVVKSKGYYTKSFDDFKNQYNNQGAIDNLYGVISQKKLYTKPKEDFYNQYFSDALKKKEDGGDVFGLGGQSILKKINVLSLLNEKDGMTSDLKTFSQNAAAKKPEQKAVFTQVQSPKKDETFRIELTDKEAEEEALSSLTRGDHKIKPDSDDPIKELSEQINIKKYSYPEYKVTKKKIDLINSNFFQTGEEAEKYLLQHADKPDSNQTKQLAIKRFGDYKKVQDALQGAGSLGEASLKLAALNGDEQVKFLMDKTSGILTGYDDQNSPVPMAMRGEKLLQLLMNKDLMDIAAKNPQLKQDIRNEIYNFPNHYPEYASKLLADAIAKKRDEKGVNNMFANIVSKDATDKIVDELIEEGSFPSNYRFVYEKEIRPKLGTAQSIGRGIGNAIPGLNQVVNESPIATPGIVENFEKGFEDFQVGTAKSIVNLPSVVGLPTLTDAIQSKEQQTFNVLKDQYEAPSFEPSRLKHKLSMHGGSMAAFVAGLGGGTSALRSSGLINNPALASGVIMGLGTLGDTRDKAMSLFPRNEFKQMLYIQAMTGLNAAMGKYLPGQQIPKLLAGGEKTIADVLKNVVDGKITTSAAKNQVMEWFGNTAKSTLHGAEFMGAISAADDVLSQVLEGKNLNLDQTLEAGWEGFKLGLIATPFLAGTEAALKSNKGFREQVIDMAERPDYYKQLAEMEAQKDPEFAKIKNDVVQNIDYASGVMKDLGQYKLSEKDKQKYVLNSLSEFIKQSKIKSATDPAIKKKLQQEAKDLSEVREAALGGIPEEKVRLNQAVRDVKELYTEDFLSKGAMEMLESKEGEEGKPKFDDGKVKSFLKFIAQQANNITEDGKFNEGSDARKSVERQYPSQLIELANEMFPEYRKTAEDFEQSPTPMSTTEGAKESVASSPLEKPKIRVTAEELESAQPKPIEETPPPKGELAGEQEMMRLAHGDTEKIYKEAGLPERLETPTKHRDQLEKEADEILKKGYDFNKIAEETMEGKRKWEDTDQVLFARKVADLKAKQKGVDINSPEFDTIQSEIEKLSRASDVAGTIIGRALEARKGYRPVEESISDYIVTEKESLGVDELTPTQKENVKKEYDDLQKAKDDFQTYMANREAELANKAAEAEITKVKSSIKKTKKTHEDYVKERKSFKDELAAARKEHEDWLKEQGIQKSGFGSLTGKEAKVIAKIVKSYAEEGITKLQDMVEKVFEEVKGVIPSIEQSDIRDVIAGKYAERKETRNQLAATLFELRQEAKLLDQLDSAFNEQPKTEKKKVQQNQRIKDLKDQIKSIKDFEKEVATNKQSQVDAAAKEQKELSKNLSKAEKEKPKLTPEQQAVQNAKNRILSQINKIQEQINKGDFSPPEKKQPVKLDAEGQKLRDTLIKLKQKRDARVLLNQRQTEGTRERALRLTAEIANIPRTLMTIGDFSGLLRQNIFFSAGHPIMTAKATPDMFRSFVSQKVYDRWFDNIEQSPRYGVAKESRLALADTLSHDLSKREEQFMSTLAEKIPVIGSTVVKGSERSYTMLLNKMRWDVFNYLVDKMEARGLTFENSPKQYKAVAEYVNNATGRSDFGERLNRIAPILNGTFFSPRLMASRVNMLTYWAQPRFWRTLPKEARIDYFRNWTSLLGTGMTILALAKLAGADVEEDPRSADFGKIKSGNTRWDIWGGSQTYVRALAQVLTGKRKSTRTGEMYDLDGKDIFGETRMDVGMRFLRGKLAPVPGAAVDILSGRTATGDEIIYEWGGGEDKEISIDQYIKERLIPMTITGTEEAIKDRGWKALFDVGVPQIFGVGTQSYKTK